MPDLPIVCTLTPDALRARREGLLTELLRQSTGPLTLGLTGLHGTREFVVALLEM